MAVCESSIANGVWVGYGQMFELNPNIKKYQSDQNQNQYIK